MTICYDFIIIEDDHVSCNDVMIIAKAILPVGYLARRLSCP
jgi:hypothetical protein